MARLRTSAIARSPFRDLLVPSGVGNLESGDIEPTCLRETQRRPVMRRFRHVERRLPLFRQRDPTEHRLSNREIVIRRRHLLISHQLRGRDYTTRLQSRFVAGDLPSLRGGKHSKRQSKRIPRQGMDGGEQSAAPEVSVIGTFVFLFPRRSLWELEPGFTAIRGVTNDLGAIPATSQSPTTFVVIREVLPMQLDTLSRAPLMRHARMENGPGEELMGESPCHPASTMDLSPFGGPSSQILNQAAAWIGCHPPVCNPGFTGTTRRITKGTVGEAYRVWILIGLLARHDSLWEPFNRSLSNRQPSHPSSIVQFFTRRQLSSSLAWAYGSRRHEARNPLNNRVLQNARTKVDAEHRVNFTSSHHRRHALVKTRQVAPRARNRSSGLRFGKNTVDSARGGNGPVSAIEGQRGRFSHRFADVSTWKRPVLSVMEDDSYDVLSLSPQIWPVAGETSPKRKRARTIGGRKGQGVPNSLSSPCRLAAMLAGVAAALRPPLSLGLCPLPAGYAFAPDLGFRARLAVGRLVSSDEVSRLLRHAFERSPRCSVFAFIRKGPQVLVTEAHGGRGCPQSK
ncbi:uncharacterized protein CLUP02_08904 [Colletotrichum lupini]|uniref:Uncharacterized protein n=1 Tax=Colletotrichum lupini TaxID=145971 RepID=A0A9Q8WHB5_9PEZI|nr:uncharacterized protein CLUP02_08904 [Colletotrichum lupini]UQC83409.1 hypothetical protein CLUP02_08904 [Colletotrichum lupini]